MASTINGAATATLPTWPAAERGADTPTCFDPRAATVPAIAVRGHAKPTRPRMQSRHPKTQLLLGRLRHELKRIPHYPDSAAATHDEISQALIRAQLGGWTLPPLDDAANIRHGDGTVAIPLISHLIFLNPWGAFRILDRLLPTVAYFELAGGDGRPFAAPAKETMQVA